MNAREFTDKELAKIERHLTALYKQAHKDISVEVQAFADTIKAKATKLLQAVNEAKTEADRKTARNAYNHFYLVEIKRNKQFQTMTNKVVERLNEANTEAASYINTKTARVYAENYNAMGADLGKGLTAYEFKPVSVDEVQQYGQLTTQTVDKRKDTAWNKGNVIAGVVGGALLAKGVDKVFSRLANTIVINNLSSSVRQSSDILTDAESKGSFDSMYRAFDEGFEIKKQWVCIFDNRTRDTHIAYNDMGPVELDYEYATGLQRPHDPGCLLLEEICNCRCELVRVYPQQDKGTRSARQGTVTGSYKEPRSFRGTKSVDISDMTYAEWMAWRS